MNRGTGCGLALRVLALRVVALLVPALAAGCGSDAALDRTLGTVVEVRGDATIGEADVARIGRAAAGQGIAASDLARLELDVGPQLLLDAGARLSLEDERTLGLEAGRLYAEAGEGEELFLTRGEVSLRLADAAVSVTADPLSVYVVRGEVSWRSGDERGVVRAGERQTFSPASTEAVALWHDWTGGLARPGPGDAAGAAGVGVLEARVPEEVGQARWPLVIRRLDVQVRVVGDLAITEVEQVFFNPASETVEGLYRIRVPEGGVLQRFAVDRAGRMVDGYVREKAQARQAYEAQVYRGSTLDPALLEWVAPGRYQARIYPIGAGETRRIVVRYAEWLSPRGGSRLYRYPMGAGRRAPRIQELSITVDVDEAGAEHVRAGMGAAIEEGRVRLRRSDFAPRADFWLELDAAEGPQRAWQAPHDPPPRAPDAPPVIGEADERDYWYLPLRLPDALFDEAREEGLDLVVVADVSAATDRAHLELGRSMVEALTAHLGEDDRVAVVTSDLTIRPLVGEAALGPADAARVDALLDALARAPAGGATDLGAALGAAAGLLDPSRSGAVIYVGDGAPTVGELEAAGLLDRMARLPAPLRLYAVAIGGDANLDLLEALTRGGGLALRVEERAAAADAALSILAHATEPVAQRVEVELGPGIENVYPRRPVDVVRGAVLPVVGRVREAPPAQITVRGQIAGEPFERTIDVATASTEASADLRLRWAAERLRQMLLDGGGREEVAELGTRYGLITPFTSYYVPSAQELSRMGASALPWMDRPSLLAEARPESGWGSVVMSVALGPLAIAGCADREDQAVAAAAPVQASLEEGEAAEIPTQEAPMGAPATTATDNRYAIQGAEDDVSGAPSSETERSRGFFADPATEEPVPEPEAVAAAAPAEQQRLGAATGDVFDSAREGLAAGGSAAGGSGAGGGGSGGGGRYRRRGEGRARPAPRRARRRSRASDRDARNDRNVSANRPVDATSTLGWDDASERGGEDGEVTVVVRGPGQPVRASAHHERRRCSDAASLSLDDRQALWDERLGIEPSAVGWLRVYRGARRACELETWRDRRAMLSRILRRAGSVERMIQVYRLFEAASARGYLRGEILRRVRSPQDLRAVREAFGLGAEPDWELVEQVLERANGDEARLRALRRLSTQYEESFDLKLRLLELLEQSGHGPEARRLAERLRVDPRSDAGVRTAVGEMFLRMDREEEARRVFSEIVEFAPLDELARRRLGDLYRAHGWYEDAYRQYQTLASIRPDDPTALLLLAQAAAGTGRIDEALRLEQRLMETGQPGAAAGIARVAQLWSSVRLAKLRHTAREAGDDDRLDALKRRMRRGGVLTGAGDLRVTLVWSHPDAQLALWAAHPGEGLARPSELTPEHGIEAFDVPEQESGAYRLEVRRADPDAPTDLEAELIIVHREGADDEVIQVLPLRFAEGRASYSFRLEGDDLSSP
ncbi:MAG: VIT domain-containing protein [Myxococcota bacterium]|nr:VIT domain-containing protein [Myxococcota bacterium]